MSIEQIESALPNGLHDAIMRRHVVDYEKRSLEFFVNVWVGDLSSDAEEIRERYESGVLRFEGLVYFVIEPSLELPAPVEPFSFSAGNPAVVELKRALVLPPSPAGTFRTYFFIYELNTFMHICASSVEFRYGT